MAEVRPFEVAAQLTLSDELTLAILAAVVDADGRTSALLLALDGPSGTEKARALRRAVVHDASGRKVSSDSFGAFTQGVTIAGLSFPDGLERGESYVLRVGSEGPHLRVDFADFRA